MSPRSIVLSLVAIASVSVAMYVIVVKLTSDPGSGSSQRPFDSATSLINSTATASSPQTRRAYLVNPKSNVWMRACAGTPCAPVAALQKSSTVLHTGRTQTVETAQGALVEWLEVTFEGGAYCEPEAMPKQSECVDWITQPKVSGWMSANQLRQQ